MRRSALPRSQWLAAAALSIDFGGVGRSCQLRTESMTFAFPQSRRTELLVAGGSVRWRKNLQKGFLFFGLTDW
jgi:hypothetical protein